MSADLARELAELLDRHPTARQTNTPTDVLADHLVLSLRAFESSLLARAEHPFYAPGRERQP